MGKVALKVLAMMQTATVSAIMPAACAALPTRMVTASATAAVRRICGVWLVPDAAATSSMGTAMVSVTTLPTQTAMASATTAPEGAGVAGGTATASGADAADKSLFGVQADSE